MSDILNSVIDTFQERPRTAILMSGGGSGARGILNNTELRDLYDIDLIATDNPSSNAGAFATEHNLDLIIDEKKRFSSREEREAYFESMAAKLGKKGVEAILYAGYMKIVSDDFARQFPGVNVHPADLRVKGDDGVALFRGMPALPLMREYTGGSLAASVHVIDNPVDTGSVISVSDSIQCDPTLTDRECHKLLQQREQVLYPKTLIALGHGSLDFAGLPVSEADL